MRTELNIIRKDWSEHQKMVAIFTFGFQATLMMASRWGDVAKGAAIGLIFSASYAFGQFCIVIDQRRGTLDTLLGLPIRPRNIILAKYAASYSMALFLVNVPGVFVFDKHTVLLINAFAVLLTTICMMPSVLLGDPRASDIPLALAFLFIIPSERYDMRSGLAHYYTALAIAALVISPVAAIISSFVFERRSLR